MADEFQPIDHRETLILEALHPELQKRAKQLLTKCRKQGLSLGIHMGMRTWEEQRLLYAKGRDAKGNIIDKKAIVTMAKPGKSWHNYGCSIDVVFDSDTKKAGIQWTWDAPLTDWKKMGAIGESVGLEWAYRWKSFPELAHLQFTGGLTMAQLQEIYSQGGLKAVWDKITELSRK